MPCSIKQTSFLLLFTLGTCGSFLAQEIQLPDRISITDEISSPWSTNLHYAYELELNGAEYTTRRATMIRKGKKRYMKRQIAPVPQELVKKILAEISAHPTNEINPIHFQSKFPADSIDAFFQHQGANYWLTNDHQRQFITTQLTEPEKLKGNLEYYFKSYDHSGYIDGTSTEVNLTFHFGDSSLAINSKSILWCGLPLEINESKNFSSHLAALLGKLIPDSETAREKQFAGDQLFAAVMQKTIGLHRPTIDHLESKTYQADIDRLKTTFTVSNTRIINGWYSTNWNGEKRLNCVLRHTSMPSNVSIHYSTTIEGEIIQYPVSFIIKDYERLFAQLMNSSFFAAYLADHKDRKLSIIYDDHSCFTDKSKERAMDYCKLDDGEYGIEKALFISLTSENNDLSRWCLLPDGHYFRWWSNGNPPEPAGDPNYLRCY